MTASRHEQIMERIRAEYREMPAMRLRPQQVQRLCGIGDDLPSGAARSSGCEVSAGEISTTPAQDIATIATRILSQLISLFSSKTA
jgi:hypothetical protein